MTWNYKQKETAFSSKLLHGGVLFFFFFLITTEMKVKHVFVFLDFSLSWWDVRGCDPT